MEHQTNDKKKKKKKKRKENWSKGEACAVENISRLAQLDFRKARPVTELKELVLKFEDR